MASAISLAPLGLGIPVNAGWNQTVPTVATGTPAHCVLAYSVPIPNVDIEDHYVPFLKTLSAGYRISYVLRAVIQYLPPLPPPPDTMFPPTPTPAEISQWESWLNAVRDWLQNISDTFRGK